MTRRGARSTPCYAAGPIDLAWLAGHLPKFQVVSSKAEVKEACPLTTKKKKKKSQRKLVMSTPFHYSSSANPWATALEQKVLERTSLFPPSDEL
jgi:hypothetical protein